LHRVVDDLVPGLTAGRGAGLVTAIRAGCAGRRVRRRYVGRLGGVATPRRQ